MKQESEWYGEVKRLSYVFGICGTCRNRFQPRFLSQFFCSHCRGAERNQLTRRWKLFKHEMKGAV